MHRIPEMTAVEMDRLLISLIQDANAMIAEGQRIRGIAMQLQDYRREHDDELN